jgi:hypothetical protein
VQNRLFVQSHLNISLVMGRNLAFCRVQLKDCGDIDKLIREHIYLSDLVWGSRMTTLMTQPWEAIRHFYAGLVRDGQLVKAGLPVGRMLELVQAIEASRYESGLHGWHSMHDLCIVQSPVRYPYFGPYLRIAPLIGGKLEFRYIDTLERDRQWHRTVEGKDGFARLERFIDQLHWFTVAD